eukprot:209424-Pelagomonas_calceolata.AAC.4
MTQAYAIFKPSRSLLLQPEGVPGESVLQVSSHSFSHVLTETGTALAKLNTLHQDRRPCQTCPLVRFIHHRSPTSLTKISSHARHVPWCAAFIIDHKKLSKIAGYARHVPWCAASITECKNLKPKSQARPDRHVPWCAASTTDHKHLQPELQAMPDTYPGALHQSVSSQIAHACHHPHLRVAVPSRMANIDVAEVCRYLQDTPCTQPGRASTGPPPHTLLLYEAH